MSKLFESDDDVKNDNYVEMSLDSKRYLEHLDLIKEWGDTEWLPEDFLNKN